MSFDSKRDELLDLAKEAGSIQDDDTGYENLLTKNLISIVSHTFDDAPDTQKNDVYEEIKNKLNNYIKQSRVFASHTTPDMEYDQISVFSNLRADIQDQHGQMILKNHKDFSPNGIFKQMLVMIEGKRPERDSAISTYNKATGKLNKDEKAVFDHLLHGTIQSQLWRMPDYNKTRILLSNNQLEFEQQFGELGRMLNTSFIEKYIGIEDGNHSKFVTSKLAKAANQSSQGKS